MTGSYTRKCLGCGEQIHITKVKKGERRTVTCQKCGREHDLGWKPFLILGKRRQ